MREFKKWLANLISRMMPTQTSSGDSSIQIGKMGGGVTQIHVTQHIYSPETASPTIHVSHPDRRTGIRPCAKEDQSQVLALMDHLPDRKPVLDWMIRQFGTGMVIELDAHQLYRLRRYVEVILKSYQEDKR